MFLIACINSLGAPNFLGHFEVAPDSAMSSLITLVCPSILLRPSLIGATEGVGRLPAFLYTAAGKGQLDRLTTER
jgi:hypothetical protein